MPGLISSVGSVHLPSTTNIIERFLQAFQRLYNIREGFHAVLSAKWELRLSLLIYVFTQHATRACAPIETILPEARPMPLYRLINDPFRALREQEHVKGKPQLADLLRP